MGNCVPKEGEESVESQDNAGSSLHQNMMREHQTSANPMEKYDIYEILGQGSMGAVSKVKIKQDWQGSAYNPKKKKSPWWSRSNSSTSQPPSSSSDRRQEVLYALKTIQLDRVSPTFIEELRNEIDILKSMDHPNIVKAQETFEYKSMIYLILDLCDGGDLYTRSPYSEKESAKIVGKLLSAVKYMHDKDIVHRDLKFENIMFESHHPDAEIKVIDFGLSKKFMDGKTTMTEGVGTIYTMAPQVLQGVYTSQADLWSTGVIAFMLLSSQKPFYQKRRRQLIDRIMRAKYSMDGPIWRQLTEESKQFCSALIELDPKKRLNAQQALEHAWLQNQFKLSDRKPTDDVLAAVDDSILRYKETSQLKKIALNVIAHKSSTDEIMHLRSAFDQYDSSNDGIITFEEFKKALKDQKYSEDVIEEIFKSIDVNQNGHISYTEFIAATLEAHGHIEEERLAEAFDRMDSDDSGFISRANLRKLMGADCSAQEIDAILNEADFDKDGQISFEDFKRAFRQKTNTLAAAQIVHAESSVHDSDANLVGLDAKIPGGKFDSEA